jgi:Protein of unknown function (DUF4232)
MSNPLIPLTGALVAAALLAAACGTAGPDQPSAAPTSSAGGSGPGSHGPGAVPPAASAPASPGSTAPAAPSPAASGGAGLAACRTGSLVMTVDDSQAGGAAGSTYVPLTFTNTSARACEMYGYPGVSFVAAPTAAGARLGAAAQRNRAFAKAAVRLAPGGTAHAWLKVTVAGNYPESACRPVTAHWLRVYPPGETVAGYVGRTFSACSSATAALLSVLPVRAGRALAGVTP